MAAKTSPAQPGRLQSPVATVDPVRAPKSWRHPDRHYLEVIRSPWYRVIVQLQDAVTALSTEFWSGKGARTLHLPIVTSSISSPIGMGSDSLPVQVELFGVRTYLADSMQFMLEYGCRLCPHGCYYVMPSFRGEDADATHLCQFFHSEAEIVGSLDDVIRVVEDYIRFLAQRLLSELASEIRSVAGDLTHLEQAAQATGFERITFDDAVRALRDDPAYVHQGAGGWRSINRSGEQKLLEGSGGFLWLTHMDHLSVPFYQAFADPENTKARNADLLFGIGEVVGSGERHATAESLIEALKLHGVPPQDYDWYVELRERYPLQTSGFGMGVERFLLWVLRHDDIRDIPLLLRFNGQDIRP